MAKTFKGFLSLSQPKPCRPHPFTYTVKYKLTAKGKVILFELRQQEKYAKRH